MSNFGLVVDNKIVVGPRDYRYSFFQTYLQENNLNFSEVPTQNGGYPFFGAGFSILPVAETIMPNLGKYEQLAGPAYTIGANSITETYSAAPKNLEAVKAELKATVAANRYAKEVKDISLTLQGTPVVVEADRLNKMMIIQITGLMGLDDTYNFKFPKSGNWLTLTKADMGTLVAAFVGQTQAAFDWEKTVVAAIDAAADFTALDAIDLGNAQQAGPGALL